MCHVIKKNQVKCERLALQINAENDKNGITCSCRQLTYRYVVVAPVALAALGAFPVLVPDVVAERHVAVDLPLALLGIGAPLGHVVLLLGTLKFCPKPISKWFEC